MNNSCSHMVPICGGPNTEVFINLINKHSKNKPQMCAFVTTFEQNFWYTFNIFENVSELKNYLNILNTSQHIFEH